MTVYYPETLAKTQSIYREVVATLCEGQAHRMTWPSKRSRKTFYGWLSLTENEKK